MMLYELIRAEILKYKRTPVPWLVLTGGFFPVFVALLFLLTSDLPVTWEGLTATALGYANMLALLLVAVFSGHTFTAEYREGHGNMLFTYPVPRLLLYAAKILVLLLPVLGLYAVFFICTALSGWVFAGGQVPAAGFFGNTAGLLLLTAAAQFVLVPLTALVSMAAKSAGAYVLSGIGYFVVYMSFAASGSARYVPPCVPDQLLQDYLATGQVISADTGAMLAVCAAVLLLLLGAGALGYTRGEK